MQVVSVNRSEEGLLLIPFHLHHIAEWPCIAIVAIENDVVNHNFLNFLEGRVVLFSSCEFGVLCW